MRFDTVLKTLALPAAATVNESPAAGAPLTVTCTPSKAMVPGLVYVPEVTTPALLVTWYAVGLVNEMVYVPGTHAAGLVTLPASIDPVPVLVAPAAVVNVPLPAGLFMNTEAPVSPAEMR